ncbi:MAG: dephospho-CoA kinase [Thiotrichales bacterium]|nr:MAG: dephospho-CoA kinase [Thiotrichales bacterium]
MYVVGLTGSIGSGKTTVAKLFAAFGVEVVEADVIAAKLTETGTVNFHKIISYFGAAFLTDAKTLNRKKVMQEITNNPEAKLWLENLLHPQVRTQIKTICQNSTAKYCIAVIPILKKTNYPWLQRILLVQSKPELQIERACTRSGLAPSLIKTILKEQNVAIDYANIADAVISNNGTQEDLKGIVAKLHAQYLEVAKLS